MSAQTEEIKELDPLVFCEIWGLSYEQASEYLNIRARTMTACACKKSSRTHRQPSSRVKALAAIHHNTALPASMQYSFSPCPSPFIAFRFKDVPHSCRKCCKWLKEGKSSRSEGAW